MIKTYRLNKTIQIHNAYVSVITCVQNVLSAFGRYITVKASTPLIDGLVNITRCGIADHASTNHCFSLRCCVSAEGRHFEHKLYGVYAHIRAQCECGIPLWQYGANLVVAMTTMVMTS